MGDGLLAADEETGLKEQPGAKPPMIKFLRSRGSLRRKTSQICTSGPLGGSDKRDGKRMGARLWVDPVGPTPGYDAFWHLGKWAG